MQKLADPGGLGIEELAMVNEGDQHKNLAGRQDYHLYFRGAILGAICAKLMAANMDLNIIIFCATVFGAYSLFWFSVGTCWLINMGVFGEALKAGVDMRQLGSCIYWLFDFRSP